LLKTSLLKPHKIKAMKSKPIVWDGPPISVVSLGCGRLSTLSEPATQAIREAEVIFGAEHHFEEIKDIPTEAETHLFPSPFSRLRGALSRERSRRIAVLASGDALFYGVGSRLVRLVGNQHLLFFPNISSIQCCFHHMGIPWQNAKVVSLHGRPLSTLNRYLESQKRLAVFTDGQSTPPAIAATLLEKGFGESKFWVCEAMGSDRQKVEQYAVSTLAQLEAQSEAQSDHAFHPLTICVVELKGYRRSFPSFPGIPDDCFSTGSEPGYGMISKKEVRLTILSLMQPGIGEVAWDIGAGCGSVSIEWARWNAEGQIYAVENNPLRMTHLIANNENFGTRLNLTPIEGTAPDCCRQLPDPDSVFIGGSGGGLESLLNYAWDRLTGGGKLVASAVTDKSEAVLRAFWSANQQRGYECEWIRLQVSKTLPDSEEVRDLRPVVLFKARKL